VEVGEESFPEIFAPVELELEVEELALCAKAESVAILSGRRNLLSSSFWIWRIW